jgi:hypothetical protein
MLQSQTGGRKGGANYYFCGNSFINSNKMKFSVDVQTESCIFPCSSSVNHESFGAKAVLWDIQVINVKSNLFNNSSTYEVNTKLSINDDNEELVNVSKHNDQMNGIKEILVGELTFADEPQKIK